MFAKVMVLDSDVLGSWRELQAFSHFDAAAIVFEDMTVKRR
jgi:hypothetical protein